MIPQLVMRIRNGLDKGFDLPLVNLHVAIKVGRRTRGSAPHQVLLNTLDHLVSLFPALARFIHPSARNDFNDGDALLDFLYDYLPFIYEPARETQLRRLL